MSEFPFFNAPWPYTYTIRIMKKLTITVSDDVYKGLHTRIGPRRISQFLDTLARPHVVDSDLDAAYRAMAADEEREAEALDWSESLVSDVADEPR